MRGWQLHVLPKSVDFEIGIYVKKYMYNCVLYMELHCALTLRNAIDDSLEIFHFCQNNTQRRQYILYLQSYSKVNFITKTLTSKSTISFVYLFLMMTISVSRKGLDWMLNPVLRRPFDPVCDTDFRIPYLLFPSSCLWLIALCILLIKPVTGSYTNQVTILGEVLNILRINIALIPKNQYFTNNIGIIFQSCAK